MSGMNPPLWYCPALPLDRVRPNPEIFHTMAKPPHKQPPWCQELVANIQKHGLASPLLIDGRKEPYTLRTGNNRYFACKQLGYETVPALVFGPRPEGIEATEIHSLEEGQSYLGDGLLAKSDARRGYRINGATLPESGRFPKPAGKAVTEPSDLEWWYCPAVPIDEVWHDQTKLHTEWHDALIADIAENGLRSPLVIQQGAIRVGTCRIRALRHLKWTHYPALWAGGVPKGEGIIKLSGVEEAESYLERGKFYMDKGKLHLADIIPATEWHKVYKSGR